MRREALIYCEQYSPVSRLELVEKIRQSMSQRRFEHVLGVEAMAIELATRHHVSLEKASVAALTHDYAKERPDEEMEALIRQEGFPLTLLAFGNPIWHGILGAYLVEKELGITDPEILQAIRLHTTGAGEMTPLDKVIYVADYVELGRDFPFVEEARQLAFDDLDRAVAFETEHTLLHLIKTKRQIYPKTIATYNAWVVNNY